LRTSSLELCPNPMACCPCNNNTIFLVVKGKNPRPAHDYYPVAQELCIVKSRISEIIHLMAGFIANEVEIRAPISSPRQDFTQSAA
jgi:hypothetical protein